MVGEDPNGDRGDGRNRVYGRGKSGEGERGKVFVARRLRLCHREQAVAYLLDSLCRADIIISNPYYYHSVASSY
jgi:hypothetical protein